MEAPRGLSAGTRALLRSLVVVLGAVAFGLGYVGFEQMAADPPANTVPDGSRPVEYVYFTLQLFLLDAAPLQQGVRLPIPLEIARFLAPASTALGLVLAGQVVLDAAIQATRVRFFWTAHTVVCGSGVPALLVARSVSEAGSSCVVVDPSADATRWARWPEARVGKGPVLRIGGDPRDSGTLRGARVATAALVVVVMGDDTASADVAATVCGTPRHRRDARCMVEMRSPGLADVLFRRTMSTGTARPPEFFDPAAAAARRLLKTYRPEGAAGPVVVLGEGPVHDALSSALGRRRTSGRLGHDPHICGPETRGAQVRALRPGLVFVCTPDVGAGVRIGFQTAHALRERSVDVVVTLGPSVALGDVVSGAREAPAGPVGKAQLRTFAEVRDVYSVAALRNRDEILEALAQEVHASYLAHALARKRKGPAVVPWEELDETFRASNREQAQSFGSLLRSVGAVLLPSEGDDDGLSDIVLTTEEVDSLAEHEHRRWVAERRRTRPTEEDGTEDPDLRPWAELPEETRKKDREAILAMPTLLRRVGFRAVRPDKVPA
ncbi:NAD-binding protein [Actinomycetospora aeridis]|uniref:NAD-binding protein n=1 Tax=Actinomycetospora aeridis TaxID=3129231 RepID=A0ABU8N7X2_9PSEU